VNAAQVTALVAAALAALTLEAAFPRELRILGLAPDLLAAAAAMAAGRPGGSLLAPVLLGALRDGVSGGVAGRFAIGYLCASLLVRAALGRQKHRGLLGAATAAFTTALLSHALAGLVSWALGRAPLQGVASTSLAVAALTAAFAPAIMVPLALVDTATGADRRRVELGRA